MLQYVDIQKESYCAKGVQLQESKEITKQKEWDKGGGALRRAEEIERHS